MAEKIIPIKATITKGARRAPVSAMPWFSLRARAAQ